eukprot:1946227-Heterocapsa_arctica.AAC.1
MAPRRCRSGECAALLRLLAPMPSPEKKPRKRSSPKRGHGREEATPVELTPAAAAGCQGPIRSPSRAAPPHPLSRPAGPPPTGSTFCVFITFKN